MTTHLTDGQKSQIRIALAKWMGWQHISHKGNSDWFGWCPKGYWNQNIPNYPDDLNACHVLELKLTDEEHREFRHALRFIVNMESVVASDRNQRDYISASAEHRSLALFRALNLGELGD